MLYTFNIAAIIRRYVSSWFRRHPVNMQWAVALMSWFTRMHQEFLAWREEKVIAVYKYNGLIHSLEWCLNDAFDPLDRQIYITVVDQVPQYYHLGDGQPPALAYSAEGMMTGYYHLADTDQPPTYLYEFLVHVPAALQFQPEAMFDLLDIYRYAGRRPAIRLYGPNDATVGDIILYQGQLQEPGNEPVLLEYYDPTIQSG